MQAVPARAIVRSYQDLHVALRERADELELSREMLDKRTGLADGACGQILAPTPMKRLGAVSMGPMLGALGLALAVVEDPEAVERIERGLRTGALTRRLNRFVRANNKNHRASRLKKATQAAPRKRPTKRRNHQFQTPRRRRAAA
jgi:hypothetical protein